ncbi:MAG: DNA ligase D [Xanthobacteraceae bacterium]|nr:DNA ligase D [Xanthobacteraceae bacterium]QYK44336.1 MAG: DNA ligase D [Xanthobacteraceae bacterium]
MADRLATYRAKRDFKETPEPAGKINSKRGRRSYLIQKHQARRLHFDFRLEHDGVLKSWAIPRGPSFSPSDKRLAVRTEDHPIAYGSFEGSIPKGQYGGGTVMLWDTGTWSPIGDPDEGLKSGKLKFEVHGKRIQGAFTLVKLRADRQKKNGKENWLLIKERDEFARADGNSTVETELTSVSSGRDMNEIAGTDRIWHSKKSVAENIAALSSERRPRGLRAKHPQPRKPKISAKKARGKRARKSAPPPDFIKPQLATLVDAIPHGDEWLHEIKYDGYRAIAAVGGRATRIYTRNGHNWTRKFAALVPALEKLSCENALLDGEIAIADAQGHTDFGALQDALASGRSEDFNYYIFDLVELNGSDLRKHALLERKQLLRELLNTAPKKSPLVYSDHLTGGGARVYAHACDMKLEGIISKRADAPYRSGRTLQWLKVKCGMEQEFVIIGWRPSPKPQRPFSSLLLAIHENGSLRYAGRVGSGYSMAGLAKLEEKFSRYARNRPAIAGIPRSIERQARFLDPVFVAEIEFRGWTREGVIRQGVFKGLREDKPPREIVKETPMAVSKAAQSRKSGSDEELIEGVRVTHPDRVLFSAQGITKRELIDHYLRVADVMLPHIVNRPLSLVRCPRGQEKDCFFQKHASQGWPEEFRAVKIKEKSGSGEYLYIEDVKGLIAAVQMGVLELHIWGSHADEVEKPDRMVFDLDPDEGLKFSAVIDAALDLRKRLKAISLESFAMASGGKGIHVVVPLRSGHSWDQHREFAEAMARVMAEENPERYVATMSKARRKGKIFVDYLRNQRGATAISPYSSRARKGASYAVPVSWASLKKLKNGRPASVGDKSKANPWNDYEKVDQPLPIGKHLR